MFKFQIACLIVEEHSFGFLYHFHSVLEKKNQFRLAIKQKYNKKKNKTMRN